MRGQSLYKIMLKSVSFFGVHSILGTQIVGSYTQYGTVKQPIII